MGHKRCPLTTKNNFNISFFYLIHIMDPTIFLMAYLQSVLVERNIKKDLIHHSKGDEFREDATRI